MLTTHLPFPLQALKPIIREAIEEAHEQIKAPVPMLVNSALAVLSLALQDKLVIKRPNGQSMPCGMFFMTIANSGERKSTADRLFNRPIREFERAAAEELQPLVDRYAVEREIWNCRRQALRETIRQEIKAGTDTSEAEEQLKALLRKAPNPPRVPKMVYLDATPAAILRGLHERWPSAGIMADEGGVVLDSRTLSQMGLLNLLWDGEDIRVDRKNEQFTLTGARLTMHLMVQEGPLRHFLEHRNGLARDMGLVARFWVCYPLSTKGTRMLWDAEAQWPRMEAFHRKVAEFLQCSPKGEPKILELSEEAKAAWLHFYNNVEADTALWGMLSDVSDGAGKMAENAIRLAGLMHEFDGTGGPIPGETMLAATTIAEWYLWEFKRLFGGPQEVAVDEQDATLLHQWLQNYVTRHGVREVKKNAIAQIGPNRLRSRIRLEAALQLLAARGQAALQLRGKTWFVVILAARWF